jgi:phage terminase small subunit
VPTVRGLTDKQRRFADLVLGGMAASRAYREAGYKAGTDRVGEAEASKLLRNPRVAAYLAERRAKAAERAEVTVADALAGLRKVAEDPASPAFAKVQALSRILDHLTKHAPLAEPLAVPAEVTEGRVAALALAVLEAAAAGRLPVSQALQLAEAAKALAEPVLAVGVARELREQLAKLTQLTGEGAVPIPAQAEPEPAVADDPAGNVTPLWHKPRRPNPLPAPPPEDQPA